VPAPTIHSKNAFFPSAPEAFGADAWHARVLDAGFARMTAGSTRVGGDRPGACSGGDSVSRTRDRFTFVYLTKGRATVETVSAGRLTFPAGSVLVLFPREAQGHAPDHDTGSDEYWIEAEGPWIERVVAAAGFHPVAPVMPVGHDDALLRCFRSVIATMAEALPGYEAIIGTRVIEIVARIRALQLAGTVDRDGRLVRRAVLHMRETLGCGVDLQALAFELGLSYSSFRRIFREKTGSAPGNYFIDMRIQRACELLEATDLPVQAVSDSLGFESLFYFSRLFKKRTGVPPSAWRAARRG
jgi:AraC-like DNA-binding protein